MRTQQLEYELKIKEILSDFRKEIVIEKEIRCVTRKRTAKERRKFKIRIRNSLEDLIFN